MCGIVGYVGKAEALPILLEALSRLEYRGYDSAGVALQNNKGIEVRRRVGKLSALAADLRAHPLHGQLGIGHCLAGDTLIQLADGRAARIDALENEVGVLSLDTEHLKIVARKARVWAHPAPATLIEIQLPFGRLRCTPQHRLLSLDDTGRLIEKRAEDLQPQDLLLHARLWHAEGAPLTFQAVESPRYYRLGAQGRRDLRQAVSRVGRSQAAVGAGVGTGAISHLWEEERNASEQLLRPLAAHLGPTFPLPDTVPVNSRHGSFVHYPPQATPEVMQFIGYLLGNGHVGRRGLRFKDPDGATLRRYQKIAARHFNLKSRIITIPNVSACLLEINSQGLADWLRRNVLDRRAAFLDEVGTLPQATLAAFLRGLLDAEGCVARQAGQVALAMTDLDLVRRLQLWLLRFGVIASQHSEAAAPHQRRTRPALKLLLTRHDALHTFQQEIGFSSPRKQRLLKAVLRTKREGFYLSSRAVPMAAAQLVRQLEQLGLPGVTRRLLRGGRRLSDGQAEKLLNALQPFPQAAFLRRRLERHLRSDVRCQEILAIQRVPATGGVVYDLAVEGTENFFANGILSHNSRWATHGEPTEFNAHPHSDCSGRLVLVHNGIIENYAPLKERLIKAGHKFRSKTDTEVVAHLVEEYAKTQSIAHAFRSALKDIRGSYALCLLSKDAPGKIFGARNGSPLLVGLGKGEALFGSDATALMERTRTVLYLNDLEVVELTKDGAQVTTLAGNAVHRKPSTVNWNIASVRKGGYPHYMLKEIHEQPEAVRQTIVGRLSDDARRLTFDARTRKFLANLDPRTRFVILGCGTAYHAGLVGEYMLEEFAKLPVVVDLASEFRYRGPMLDKHTTVLAITQSGETADTLAGIRMAKEQGANVLAVCNVMGSSIAREADAVLYTHAGPEIAVASTKAYTCQVTTLALLTLFLAKSRRGISPAQWRRLAEGIRRLPETLEQALKQEDHIKRVAAKYASVRDFYYLGRRYNYPSALEGALKLKEICPLIHAEGYAAGEMKHGPISLIRPGWPVLFLATDSPVYEKVISNIEEVRARKGSCIVVASEGDQLARRHAEAVITVPKTDEFLSPIVSAIPLQLFAYYVADANGCDIDQPPNLAKSVTVE